MIGVVVSAGPERFRAALSEGRRRRLEAFASWPERLARALDEPARAGLPPWLSREALAAELARRFDGDTEEAERWWDHLHAADLYLATACARGVGGAIVELERRFGDEIARAARRFERPGLGADELVQRLRAKLFAGEDGARGPRIAAYSGQGFLQNWVRVAATRTFIDCTRGADEPAVSGAEKLVEALPEPGADPELHLLKREHRAHFREALAEAVAQLPREERTLLRQQLVEGLTIDQLAELYHLHRATAARRLAKVREALLAGARAALARRLGVPGEALDSVVDLLSSRLEVSFARLLG
jgi:RNA polymerase sigma-70 factor (ECF subfamily)